MTPPIASSESFPYRRRAPRRRPGTEQGLEAPGWAPLHYADLASPLLERQALSVRWVWAGLWAASWRTEDPEVRVVDVGYGALAAHIGVDRSSVRRAVRILVELGLVSVKRRWGVGEIEGEAWHGPSHLPNRYRVRRPSDAVAAVAAATARRKAGKGKARRRPHAEALEAFDQVAGDLSPAEAGARLAELLARQEAEVAEDVARARRAAARRWIGPLEQLRDELQEHDAALEGLPAIPTPGGVVRARAVAEASIAYEALRTESHAARLVARLRAEVDDVLEGLGEDAPPAAELLERARLALARGPAAARLVGDARVQILAAQVAWVPVWEAHVRAPRPPSMRRRPARRGGGWGRAVDGVERWTPPADWRPLGLPTAQTWRAQRALWEQATAEDRRPLLRRLRAQGFEPDWPDPPLPES